MATHPPLSSGAIHRPVDVLLRRIRLQNDESGRYDRQTCRPRDVLARAQPRSPLAQARGGKSLSFDGRAPGEPAGESAEAK